MRSDSAERALEAALASVRASAEESRPGELRIAVCFGLQTGEAKRRGADYSGPTLNLAARIRGEAGGGQILLSSATTELVVPPEGYGLVDLGP